MSLFRREVLEARVQSYLGPVRAKTSWRASITTAIASSLAILLVVFSATTTIARRTTVPGLLVPAEGIVQVSSNTAGLVGKRSVAEGSFVRAGDTLLVILTDREATNGDTASQVDAILRKRDSSISTTKRLAEVQAGIRRAGLNDRIGRLDQEAKQAEAELSLAKQRLALAEKSLLRFEQLTTSGFISPMQLQTKQEEVIDLKARVQASARALAAIERDRASTAVEYTGVSAQLQSQLEEIDRERFAIATDVAENQTRRQIVIKATHDGILSAYHVSVGSFVQSGQVLGTFLPQSRQDTRPLLHAELYAPSRTAGFVRPGNEVWIRYSSYPFQKFGMAKAVVDLVSPTPINPQDLPTGQSQGLLTAARTNEPMFRIIARLESQSLLGFGRPIDLSPGTTLEANIVQERRTILEWITDPLWTAGRNGIFSSNW